MKGKSTATMVHSKPAAQGRTATATAGRSQAGRGDGKGPAENAVNSRFRGATGLSPSPPFGSFQTGNRSRPLWVIPPHNTDSHITPPLTLTPEERAALIAAIESEEYTLRKMSSTDFLHGRRLIRAQSLQLEFLAADQRQRLRDCPLPTKGEVLKELEDLRISALC